MIRIVPATPDEQVNCIYAMLLSAIGAATDSVHLNMAYFAPRDDMVEALSAAALPNNEVNAVVIGEDFGQAMEQMFRQDVEASKTISLDAWRDRSLWQRGKGFFARLFERWW